MPRFRLYDLRFGRFSEVLGLCQGDVSGIAQLANAAQLRLLTCREMGETGWWGSWARTRFNLTQSSPHLTLPRQIARVINLDVCQHPVRIQNEFFEFMEFGIGKQPHWRGGTGSARCRFLEMYDRGTVPTFVDLPANSIIRVYLTSGDDGGQRVLLQGLDTNGDTVYSQDGYNQVEGQFVSLVAPFVDLPFQLSRITGIQKDVTSAPVQIFAVDPTTGTQTLLLTMDPGEGVAGYRRYLINGLPANCCGPQPRTAQPLQVEGMAKLELIPVVVDTDYLLIQHEEALIAEAKAIRYGDMDSTSAKNMSALHHTEAVRMLQGQLVHYLGKEMPAVVFAPFGSASLERVKIGMM